MGYQLVMGTRTPEVDYKNKAIRKFMKEFAVPW